MASYKFTETPVSQNYGAAANYVSVLWDKRVDPAEIVKLQRALGIYSNFDVNNNTAMPTVRLPRFTADKTWVFPYLAPPSDPKLIQYKTIPEGIELRNFYTLILEYATAYDLALACIYAAMDSGTILRFKLDPDWGFLLSADASLKLYNTTKGHSFEKKTSRVVTLKKDVGGVDFSNPRKPVPLWTPDYPISMQAYGKAVFAEDSTTENWMLRRGSLFGFTRQQSVCDDGSIIVMEKHNRMFYHGPPHILGFKHVNAGATRVLMYSGDILPPPLFKDPSNGAYGMIQTR